MSTKFILLFIFLFFFFNDTPTTEIYTLSLHDALPILRFLKRSRRTATRRTSSTPEILPEETTPSRQPSPARRSEEHTSELQSRFDLVCRLLLEKKKERSSHLTKQLSLSRNWSSLNH